MDELAGLAGDSAASADNPPATPPVDIEARLKQIEDQFAAKLDERFKGFQQVVAKKDKELEATKRELREEREAQMSDAEKAEARKAERDDELADAKRQLLLYQLAEKYPDEVPVFKAILEAGDESAEAQLEAIRRFRAPPAAPSQDPPAEVEPDVPPVDPNNPLTTLKPSAQVIDGQLVTDDWAEKVLAQNNIPGAMAAGR